MRVLAAMGFDVCNTQSGQWNVAGPKGRSYVIRSGKPGWGDVTTFFDASWRKLAGKILIIEVKTGSGRLTEKQEAHRNRVLDAGGVHVVVRDSVEDLFRAIEKLREVR